MLISTPTYIEAIVDLFIINFFISVPILVISAIGQWVIQFRLIPEHNVAHMAGLRCILYTQISAYILSLIIWILWPIDPLFIMYNNRISIPAVIAEAITIPLWMKYFGYFKSKESLN